MAKFQIWVPDDLMSQMRDMKLPESWSKVACRAFAAAIRQQQRQQAAAQDTPAAPDKDEDEPRD